MFRQSLRKPELHSWLDSSGSVFVVALFGKASVEITLLVVMAKHCRRPLSYTLQCLTLAGLTPAGHRLEAALLYLPGDTYLQSRLCGAVQLCLLDCAWAYSWGILCVTGKKHNCRVFEYLFVSTVCILLLLNRILL